MNGSGFVLQNKRKYLSFIIYLKALSTIVLHTIFSQCQIFDLPEIKFRYLKEKKGMVGINGELVELEGKTTDITNSLVTNLKKEKKKKTASSLNRFGRQLFLLLKFYRQ